jgi:hypothetical protein
MNKKTVKTLINIKEITHQIINFNQITNNLSYKIQNKIILINNRVNIGKLFISRKIIQIIKTFKIMKINTNRRTNRNLEIKVKNNSMEISINIKINIRMRMREIFNIKIK